MRKAYLLVCLPLGLACGGSSAPLPAPEKAGSDPLIDFDPETLVRFSLVADSDKLQVGGQATLGALFVIEEGWHIYWINPGESGLPTKITLEPAPGLTVDAPRFPGPARFDSNDEIVNYGYHQTLLVPMQVSAIEAGEPVELSAKGSWLACRDDACVPGKGSASLLLSRGDEAGAPSEQIALFEQANELLPKDFQGLSDVGAEAELLPEGDHTRISIRAKNQARLEIFPIYDEAVTDLAEIEAGIQFTLHPAADHAELAVLAVGSDSNTHYFAITSALLQAAANHQEGSP